MGLYTQYKTDKKAEKEGVKFEVMDGVYFIVARIATVYYAGMAEINRKFKSEIAKGIESEKYKKAKIRCFVDHCITGWVGVTDENDKPLEFTKENCTQVLFDLPDLADMVMMFSTNADNYNAAMLEEEAKNS